MSFWKTLLALLVVGGGLGVWFFYSFVLGIGKVYGTASICNENDSPCVDFVHYAPRLYQESVRAVYEGETFVESEGIQAAHWMNPDTLVIYYDPFWDAPLVEAQSLPFTLSMHPLSDVPESDWPPGWLVFE